MVRKRTKTYSTDESGKVEIPFRLPDPDAKDDDRDGELRIDVLYSEEPVIDEDTEELVTRVQRWFWSDNDEDATILLFEQDSTYTIVTRDGRPNRLTATLLDQYGDPVRRKLVHFTSEEEDGLYSKEDENDIPLLDEARGGYRKTTSSKGVATASYRWDGDESAIEVIYAQTADVGPVTLEHYWVKEIPERDTTTVTCRTTTGDLLHHDEDRDALVIEDGPDLYVVSYDQDDHFNDADRTMSYKAFKEAVEEALDRVGTSRLEVVVTDDDDDPIRFTLL